MRTKKMSGKFFVRTIILSGQKGIYHQVEFRQKYKHILFVATTNAKQLFKKNSFSKQIIVVATATLKKTVFFLGIA